MRISRRGTFRFLRSLGAYGVCAALCAFGFGALLPFEVGVAAMLSIVPFIAAFVIGSNGLRFPAAPRPDRRYLRLILLGAALSVLSLLTLFLSLLGVLSGSMGLLAFGSLWIWVVMLCVGLVGTLTAEESAQSLDQIMAMIAGSGR